MKIHPVMGLFICLFFSIHLWGQQKDCTYADYFYLTDRAIVEWNEGEKAAALIHLKKALALPVFPRGKQVAMALQWAVECQEPKWAEALAFKLVKAGVSLEYFEKYQTQPWYGRFSAEAPDSIAAGIRIFNFELRRALLDLRSKDSLFTDNYHLWMKCEYPATLDEMIHGAEAIQDGFIELIRAYGFPSEKRMGYYYQEGEVQDFPVLTIMIHIYQRGNLILNEHLPELVCDGALTKVEMAVLKDYRGFGNSTGCRQEMEIRGRRRKCE